MQERYQYEITVHASAYHDGRGGILAQRVTNEFHAMTPAQIERRIEVMGGKIGGFERRVTIRMRTLGEWKQVVRTKAQIAT